MHDCKSSGHPSLPLPTTPRKNPVESLCPLAQLDSQKVRDVSCGDHKEQELGTWEEPGRQRWKGGIN